MTQLSGAHAFHRFFRQLSTDFQESLNRTFPSHVSTSIKKFVESYAELQKLDHLTCSKLKLPSINPLH